MAWWARKCRSSWHSSTTGQTPERPAYFEALSIGGYPAAQRLTARTRRRWFTRYVETVLAREIEMAADIRRSDAFTSVIRYLAATTAQELVVSTVGQRVAIDRGTAQHYASWRLPFGDRLVALLASDLWS